MSQRFPINLLPVVQMCLLGVLLIGCHSGKKPTRTPIFHNPLVSSKWSSAVPQRSAPSTSNDAKKKKRPSTPAADQPATENLRERAIARATSLLSDAAKRADYGVGDVAQVLNELVSQDKWRAADGLRRLVTLAKRLDAFHTGDRPTPGDIVLFHNQLDANGNGQLDDWLSGCGIVISRQRDRFEAVARTGNAPRRVSIWPDEPNRQSRNGEPGNSYLRIPHRSDRTEVRYLAGALYAGYIDLERLVTGLN